ncbi:MAG: hypothetical protein Q9227_001478 [Pyrenula ochraceoflavens]
MRPRPSEPQQSPAPHPPPRPPLPNELQRSSPHLQNQTMGVQSPPPPPPKPSSAQQNPPRADVSTPNRYDAPPPLPNKPSSVSGTPQENGHAVGSFNAPQRSTSLRQSVTTQQMQRSAEPQYPQGPYTDPRFVPPRQQEHPVLSQPSISSPQPQRPFSISSSSPPVPPLRQPSNATTSQQPYPTNQTYMPQGSQQAFSSRPDQVNKTQSLAQPKPQPLDLLSSPFDVSLPTTSSQIPAPPVPRNPEKDALLSHVSRILTQTLHQKVSQNGSALAPLYAQSTALSTALSNLNSEISHLNQIQGTLQSNIATLHSSLASADQAISSAQSRSAANDLPTIDEMLVPPTVVAKQLYDVVCDERGIEAALWALQTALGRGRISIDGWAKRSRELAREGFRKRWMARKIGRGMNLIEGT